MLQESDELRNIFEEEIFDPKYADKRNLYKLEKWTTDGAKIDRLRTPAILKRRGSCSRTPSNFARESG
jgi:hypothetical protein